ncbi:MAG: molecular chaperone TorD family protein [Burkholderiaceae bacterium]
MADAADPDGIEAGRAAWYELLSALFYRAPSPDLYAQLRAAPRSTPDADTELMVAWHALLDVVDRLSRARVEAEYDTLFGGVGRPDIYLFGSHHLAGFLNEKPLVDLRDDLRSFGLERSDRVLETEDHIACLLGSMQQLIADEGVEGLQRNEDGATAGTADLALDRQHTLFRRHIASWSDTLCELVSKHPKAEFYARLADLLVVFVAIERQAFEMMELNTDSSTKN